MASDRTAREGCRGRGAAQRPTRNSATAPRAEGRIASRWVSPPGGRERPACPSEFFRLGSDGGLPAVNRCWTCVRSASLSPSLARGERARVILFYECFRLSRVHALVASAKILYGNLRLRRSRQTSLTTALIVSSLRFAFREGIKDVSFEATPSSTVSAINLRPAVTSFPSAAAPLTTTS